MVNVPCVKILGAGRIGFFFGGLLLSCGYQVQFIGRERILKEVQDAEGFYCTDIKGGEIYNPISRVDCREDYEIQFDDIIIIAVKNTALDSVARELSQKLKNVAENSVTLISLLNGVRHFEVFSEFEKRQKVLFGVFGPNITKVLANEKRLNYHLATLIPVILQDSPITSRIQNNLKSCPVNLEITLTKDIKAISCGKLITNLHNSVSALTYLTLIEELSSLQIRLLLAEMIDEGLKVYKANNIKSKGVKVILSPAIIKTVLRMPNWLYFILAKKSLQMDKNARSSMYDDLSSHRPTEIDYLNGEISTLGRKKNIPTPVNDKIVALIKKAEQDPNFKPYSPSELVKLSYPNAPSPFQFLVLFYLKFFLVICFILILYFIIV